MQAKAERKYELQRKLEESLQQKQQRKEEKETTALNSRLKLSREIIKYGGQWKLNEIDEQVRKMTPR